MLLKVAELSTSQEDCTYIDAIKVRKSMRSISFPWIPFAKKQINQIK